MPEHHYRTAKELDHALAAYAVDALTTDLNTLGYATLVVSGGSTPKGLFEQLSNADLDWQRVTVLLADDRWVPLDSPDSNEGMLKDKLLVNKATPARFISLLEHYPLEEDNVLALCKTLSQLPTFSLVILGMGNDMHTASLFPCSPEIQEGLNTHSPVLMTHPTTAPHARVSLSKQRLSQTRRGLVHIVGDDKKSVLEQARRMLSPEKAPVSAFLEPVGAFDVWWAQDSQA